MKHENDVSDCRKFVRIYNFLKEIKLNKRVSYNVFLFVSTENNSFRKKIQNVLRAYIVW